MTPSIAYEPSRAHLSLCASREGEDEPLKARITIIHIPMAITYYVKRNPDRSGGNVVVTIADLLALTEKLRIEQRNLDLTLHGRTVWADEGLAERQKYLYDEPTCRFVSEFEFERLKKARADENWRKHRFVKNWREYHEERRKRESKHGFVGTVGVGNDEREEGEKAFSLMSLRAGAPVSPSVA